MIAGEHANKVVGLGTHTRELARKCGFAQDIECTRLSSWVRTDEYIFIYNHRYRYQVYTHSAYGRVTLKGFDETLATHKVFIEGLHGLDDVLHLLLLDALQILCECSCASACVVSVVYAKT